jgi:hypothetical protein
VKDVSLGVSRINRSSRVKRQPKAHIGSLAFNTSTRDAACERGLAGRYTALSADPVRDGTISQRAMAFRSAAPAELT